MRLFASVVFATLFLCSAAFADLDTFTYISTDGGGSGAYEGDISAVAPVTILDSDGGDIWNGGDQMAYLHQEAQIPAGASYTAKVRVVSQTQAIDGRWGKSGIVAVSSLAGSQPMASAQVAFGNGSNSQLNADGTLTAGLDTRGDPALQSPVPVRLAGRTGVLPPDSGFEDNIAADAAYTGAIDVDGNVANVLESRWLSLQYDAATNQFIAGIARDLAGVEGTWNYSAPRDDVAINAEGGHYIGLGYSAHDDLDYSEVTRPDDLHGITYDSFSLTIVPEPASFGMIAFGILGLLGFRRRNR